MTWFKSKRRTSEAVDAVADIEAHAGILNDDQGQPQFNDAARPMAPGAKGFLILLAGTVLFLLVLLIVRMSRSDSGEPQSQFSRAKIENVLPSLKLAPPMPPPPVPTPEPQQPPVVPELARATTPTGEPKPSGLFEDPVEKRRLMPGLQGQQTNSNSSSQSGAPAANSNTPRDEGPMAERLRPLRLTMAKAGLLHDRDLLLTQGAMIDCVQQTKFVSAQAGMITCYATREVRSASGRVVLIDPGTIFVGYQQSVLAHGQPRIGIVWSRLETPDGVVVHLDSPGTGALGEAGLDGEIDTHFAARFGGAIMISLIGDLGNWLSRQGSGSNNEGSIRFDNSSDAAQQAVTTVLDNTINIPPTLYRNQGGRIGIYVARDLDFSSVYSLRPASATQSVTYRP